MKWIRHLLLLGFSLLCLQSCLLDYFLAPKIAPEDLPVQENARELRDAYAITCGKCHLLVAPRFYDAEHPIERYTQRYRNQRILNAREADVINTYIHALAATP